MEDTEINEADVVALAATVGLHLPEGALPGVTLHLATAQRMVKLLDDGQLTADALDLGPVFTPSGIDKP